MRSITDAYGLGTHTIYTQPDRIHMYCTIQSMNRVLQGRRQLLVEVRRLGSYRGYDNMQHLLLAYKHLSLVSFLLCVSLRVG